MPPLVLKQLVDTINDSACLCLPFHGPKPNINLLAKLQHRNSSGDEYCWRDHGCSAAGNLFEAGCNGMLPFSS